MKTFEQFAAQGDLIIARVDTMPDGVIPVDADGERFVIAHSETGHNHVMERPNVKMYRLPDEIYEAFIVVDKPTPIEHQRSFDTHEPIMVPPGTYRINRQREYTPEGFRRAAD